MSVIPPDGVPKHLPHWVQELSRLRRELALAQKERLESSEALAKKLEEYLKRCLVTEYEGLKKAIEIPRDREET